MQEYYITSLYVSGSHCKRAGHSFIYITSSLVYCSQAIYTHNPTDARTALAMISDASEVLGLLLNGGHTTLAGRLCGAFRNIGRDKVADDISKTMKAAMYEIRETDPFETKL